MAKTQRERERDWDRKGNPNAKNWGKATTAKSKAAEKAKMDSSPRPKARPEKAVAKSAPKAKAAAKDPMAGYRKGDVKTSPIGGATGGKSRRATETASRTKQAINKGAEAALGRAEKRAKEPMASKFYDKVYGKNKWKTKDK